MRGSFAVDVQVGKGPDGQVRRGAQLQDAGRDLFARFLSRGVRIRIHWSQLGLGIGRAELAFQLLAHARSGGTDQELATGAIGGDLQRERLGQGDGRKEVLGGRQRRQIGARGHHFNHVDWLRRCGAF